MSGPLTATQVIAVNEAFFASNEWLAFEERLRAALHEAYRPMLESVLHSLDEILERSKQ